MRIFKIVQAREWRDAERTGEYCGSAKDREDGFLHFSDAGQVRSTLEKYYSGMDDLVLVCVEAGRLGPALKYEPSRDGALFPHLYGALRAPDVAWARPIELVASGAFALPSLDD